MVIRTPGLRSPSALMITCDGGESGVMFVVFFLQVACDQRETLSLTPPLVTPLALCRAAVQKSIWESIVVTDLGQLKSGISQTVFFSRSVLCYAQETCKVFEEIWYLVHSSYLSEAKAVISSRYQFWLIQVLAKSSFAPDFLPNHTFTRFLGLRLETPLLRKDSFSLDRVSTILNYFRLFGAKNRPKKKSGFSKKSL